MTVIDIEYLGPAPEDIDKKLPFCGCGHGDEHFDNLIEYLTLIKDKDANQREWANNHEHGPMYAELLSHIADHAGLAEHGTALPWAWLTDDGERLLAYVDSDKYQEYLEFMS